MTTLYPSMQFTMIVRLKLSLAYPKLEIAANNLGKIITPHSVIFLGEMQTKFYCQNIGILVIFDKKMFKFLCHMIESNHYWG